MGPPRGLGQSEGVTQVGQLEGHGLPWIHRPESPHGQHMGGRGAGGQVSPARLRPQQTLAVLGAPGWGFPASVPCLGVGDFLPHPGQENPRFP